jgi:hypothetical protein
MALNFFGYSLIVVCTAVGIPKVPKRSNKNPAFAYAETIFGFLMQVALY